MSAEQRIRAVLFYFSVFVFLAGLPFILASGLGYKFNTRTFKFTKTGLIAIKTQPQGALVYFENRLINEKTPTTLNELLPGKYSLKLELEGHYPYFREVEVEEGKVSRLEKVILFPLRADIKQLNKEKLSSIFLDESRGMVYYVNQEENTIFKSDMFGEHFEKSAKFLPLAPPAKQWKLSGDKEKILCFNLHQIEVIYLERNNQPFIKEAVFILNYPNDAINDVYWYGDSYHIILIANTRIDILEANPQSNPVTLVRLNKKNAPGFYDIRTDSIYFLDSQQAADGKAYDNLYKLELSSKSFYLQDLIKLKSDE